ncbi:MAG TPA: M20/M25/M40 family metallo-hydrolase [Thermoleophilaceae bacterium]|nr:M20/M25/M40 family metallo-hydrolase [Thermoleophilaceae bacterium]
MAARLRADVGALAAIERPSAGAGEQRSAAWVVGRLRELGCEQVRSEPYRYASTFAWSQAAHYVAGVAAAAVGSRTLAAAALASHELEYSGRCQWLRRLLPAGEGANAVGRLPARGERRRALLLVAHHDAARTGLMWDPRFLAAGNRAAQRTGKRASLALLPELALALAAIGGRVPRVVAATLLGTAIALLAQVARGPAVPGANDNASGVAAMLAVVEELARERPEGLEVIALAPGSEEAGMGGMAAWLNAHGHELDPATTFVLGLDTVGSGEPVVLTAEGGLWPVRYRGEDVEHAERAAAAVGVELRRWRLGAWTDPVLARLAGLPTVSILSVRDGGFPNYHLPSDTPEQVDYDCVERCVRAAAAIARA